MLIFKFPNLYIVLATVNFKLLPKCRSERSVTLLAQRIPVSSSYFQCNQPQLWRNQFAKL